MRARSWAALIVLATASAATVAGQGGTERPAITGISHVAFRVSQAAGASRFYGRVLGLAPRGDGARVEYAVGERQYLRITADLPAGEDERLDHLAFATTDAPRLRTYLASRGIAVDGGTTPCVPGGFVVRDPDNHPIEFVPVPWPPRAPATPSDSSRALSSRILHAGLIVRDEAAAHRFYRDVLGFSEIWRGGRDDTVVNWINMRVPDGTDYLEYMLTTGAADRRQRGSSHHVCLVVPDVQTAYETVARRMDRATAVPNVGRNGRWQLNLFDDDGTRIELMEPFRIR